MKWKVKVKVSVLVYFQAWLSEIKDYGQDDVLIMLLANKCDLETERVISTHDGELLAKVFI